MLKKVGLGTALLGAGMLMTASAAVAADTSSGPARAMEQGRLRLDDNITLRTLTSKGHKSEAAVLLLHGFPETMYAWEDVIQRLPPNIDAYAFDWPGYGYSSRPAVDRFAYTPRDYAQVLKNYLKRAGLNRSKLTIYATDIGALPALLLAIDDPAIARSIVVGDFAPFDRAELMYESLRGLKDPATSAATRVYFEKNSDQILTQAFYRGLPAGTNYKLPATMEGELRPTWNRDGLTTGDAFYHYYAGFTRDQRFFEENVQRVRTPVKVIWGAEDVYIRPPMAEELATKLHAALKLYPDIGHYPHLQDPQSAVDAIVSIIHDGATGDRR